MIYSKIPSAKTRENSANKFKPRTQFGILVVAAIVAIFAIGIASRGSTSIKTAQAQSEEIQISNLTVSSSSVYQIDDFAGGIPAFVDRSYNLQNVPASWTGNIKFIRTANNDKLESVSPFMTFDVNADATVVIGYDDRLALPAWLQSFDDTQENLTIDGNTHSLYYADFSEGQVSLGANEGIQASSMYVVLVAIQGTLEDDPPPPPPPGDVDWLRVEGNNIVNESGDVVVLRGINIDNREWNWAFTKSIEYERNAIPVATRLPSDNDGWGSNVILIAVASGPINRGEQDYLEALDEIVDIAKAEGAYTLIVYRYGEPNTQQAHFPGQDAEDAMAVLADRFASEPAVLYGLQVEPSKQGSIHESLSQREFWDQVLKPRFDTMTAAIHANNPNALVVVPGTQWGRRIEWALDNPVSGGNIIYKTHPYDTWDSIESSYRLDEIASVYPVLIGEFGPGSFMSQSDVDDLLDFAEQQGMSWTAWLFHEIGCPCLLDDSVTFEPSAYGQTVKDRLQAAAGDDPPPSGDPKILVFHKTGQFVHSSTDDGVAAIHQLGDLNGFDVDDTIDATAFTDANLAQYDAVVFLNTHQEVVNDSQQAAFERYIQAGGGYVGIHIASGTEYSWGWYGNLVGARFNNHPPQLLWADVIVEDPNNPSSESLPEVWSRVDEWHNYFNGPNRNNLHIILRLDETTYEGGTHGDDHPIAWCQEYDGGRSWFTGLGHTDESYYDPFFLSHILGGIQYSAGIVDADCTPTPDPPPPPPVGLVSDIDVASGQQYSVSNGGFGEGAQVFLDRQFGFVDAPQSLLGSTYVITANSDKQDSSNPFLTFNINSDATVYVAYDDRLTIPVWLNDFADSGLDVQIDGNNHSLLEKLFSEGSVVLGGNEGVDASSMYSVIVAEVALEAPILNIVSPGEGETITEANLPIFYSLTGGTSEVDHITLSLNGGLEEIDADLDGKHIFADIPAGSYSLAAHLSRADGSEIEGTEVTASFDFENETFQGNPPITPKWAFEPWVWEDNSNTQTSTEGLVEGYTSRGIPVGAVIIDSPWSSNYSSMVFSQQRYPDAQAMIDDFHSQGIKVIMWTTGFQNIGAPDYESMKEQGYAVHNGTDFTWWKGTGVHLDFTNPDAREWWHGLMDKVLDMGVDGWKLDAGADMLSILSEFDTYLGPMSSDEFKKYYYADFFDYTQERNLDSIALARAHSHQFGNGAPVSKLSIGWMGDNNGDWEGFREQIDDNYNSADEGYGAFGAEIGGYNFDGGTPDKNLLIRWAQFGATVPLMENGGSNGGEAEHLPWFHGDEAVDIYRYFATLHSELSPYMFSYGVESNLHGGSIMRNPDPDNWQHELGESILVSTVSDNVFQKTVVFPAGSNWIDYWDRDIVYAGGTTITYDVPLDKSPIFFRSGSIIPMHVSNSLTGHGDEGSADKETLLIFPEGETSFLYHKPLGEGVEYSDVTISMDEWEKRISVDGNESDDYRFQIKWPSAPIHVEGADAWSYDEDTHTLVIDATGEDFELRIAMYLPVLSGESNAVQDLDSDGFAEDMNGNGRLDFADLVLFYNQINSDEVQQNQWLFDFDRNRSVDVGDVVFLFSMMIPE